MFVDGSGDFSLRDFSTNNSVFIADKNASFASLVLGIGGKVGIGNSPSAELHVHAEGFKSELRLETPAGAGAAAQAWSTIGRASGFTITDVTNSNHEPFFVATGSTTNTLRLSSSGRIGLGTSAPDLNSTLDIRSNLANGLLAKRPDAGAHFLCVENTGGIFRAGVQGNGDAQGMVIHTAAGAADQADRRAKSLAQ
ncbi:MAG: hypothetical protein IAG10_29210 [Planctomycetaceae bacterium]|nr:hypothetical protein [Planctomycetaceae bacterium]